MLSKEEEKELGKLSNELKGKVLAMFSSPYYQLFNATDMQITAFCEDIVSKPYTIRGSGDNDNSKAEFDSMIKAMDKIDAITLLREKYRTLLTEEEKKEVDKKVAKSKTVAV